MKKRFVWVTVPVAVALSIAAGRWFMTAQAPAIVAPFLTTPSIPAVVDSGPNAGYLLYGRRLNGLYEHGIVGLFNPYSWVTATATLADVMSEGLGNLMAAPGGPPNVGRASQMGGGGKFTSGGALGVAYLTYGTSAVFVTIASPSFTYQGVASYNIGPNTYGLIAADFNGDGVLDLAVSYQGAYMGTPGGVAVLINKGDGTFNAPVTYTAGPLPAGLAAYDVNHDNVLDLVVTDNQNSSVYVLTGNSNGTFNAAAPYAVAGTGNSVTIADVDGDGNPDLAVAGGFGPGFISILLNNGNGTFRAGSSTQQGTSATYIAAGDFNGDSKLDLAVVDFINQTVNIYINTGGGSFQAGAIYATAASPDTLVLTDFDHDGKLDVLVASGDARAFGANPDSEAIDYLLGRGDGTFHGLMVSAATASSSTYFFSAVADFNNDGNLDVITGDFYGRNGKNLYLFTGNGDGTFAITPTTIALDPVNQVSGYSAAVGDFNGDGKPDLAVASGYGGNGASNIYILLNNGSGLGPATSFAPAGGSNSIAAGDFDGDGKLDLASISVNQGAGTVQILRGQGNGTFQPLQTYTVGMNPQRVIAADVNGDGRMDLVIADSGMEESNPGAVYVLKNTGGGNFSVSAPISAGAGTYPKAVAAGDVNGDGNVDLVVAADILNPNYSNGISVLKGNGDGTFQAAVMASTEFGPTDIAVRDFNGDGKADLVVAHCCGATDTTYFQGNGDGTFAAEVHFNGPSSPYSLTVADLNKDGAPDIVIGGNTGAVAGLLNTTTNFPCSYQLDKTSLSPLQPGGTYVVNIATGPSCNWSVSGLPDWITVSGASSGTGSGSVTLIVASTAAARNATISIAGINVNITQTLAPVCNYAVYPGGETFPSSGGTGNFSVTVNSGCAWTVSGVPAWINITSGSNGNGNGSGTFTVAANTSGGRTGSMTIAGQTFRLEQETVSLSGASPVGSLGQVVSEGTWAMTLAALNLGTSSAQVRFNFTSDMGSPMQLPLNFPQMPAGNGPLLASTIDRTLAPGAQVVMMTNPDSAMTSQGWGQLLGPGTVSGFGIFSNPALKWEAVVPLESRNAASYILAFDNTGSIATGLAIANLSGSPASVPVILRDSTGAQIGSGSISLQAFGHTSFMLTTQYSMTMNQRGTVEFDTPSGGQISVLGLRANGPALTTLPVLANVGTGGGSITHILFNGGFTNNFTLVNTGTSSASATLSFFGDDGSALNVPMFLPQTSENLSGTTLTRTLAPGASLLIQTVDQGQPNSTEGSAALATSGNISGFGIFRWTQFQQEASVPLETRNAASYILPIDDTNGNSTGLAITNLANQPANITINIRDDTGSLVQTTSLMLSANGHTSFMLPTQYAAAMNIRGTVEFVTPLGGRISVIGLRATSAGTLTTIPVLTDQ